MLFPFRVNMTMADPAPMQWPLTVGLSTLAAALVGFLAFLSYTPAVYENSPAFTSNTIPFIGSLAFGTDPW